jgi:LAO/AO transport system kinase
MEVDGLVRGVLAGDRRAVARAISLVEDGRPELERLSAGIYGATGRAVTVGITGAPGVGKSTLAGGRGGARRARARRGPPPAARSRYRSVSVAMIAIASFGPC